MNERIRELAKQAGDYVNETYTGPVRSKTPGKIWEDGHIGWNEQFQAKFAELIVRECMACSTWVGKMNTNSVEPIHTAYAINQRIKQQFGVEE
jgi:hypothetical protein